MDVLTGMPGTRITENGITLPPLEIWGSVDPLLESALLEHEAVAEAAVVPAPDAVRLAVPKAYVVLAAGYEPGPDTAKLLFEHSRAVLAPYKRLRRLEFGALAKTVSGRIRRIELREATAAGPDAEYREEDFR